MQSQIYHQFLGVSFSAVISSSCIYFLRQCLLLLRSVSQCFRRLFIRVQHFSVFVIFDLVIFLYLGNVHYWLLFLLLFFIRSGSAKCLLDRPSRKVEYKLPKKMAGEIFTHEEQCQLVFGKGYETCSIIASHHSHLYPLYLLRPLHFSFS